MLQVKSHFCRPCRYSTYTENTAAAGSKDPQNCLAALRHKALRYRASIHTEVSCNMEVIKEQKRAARAHHDSGKQQSLFRVFFWFLLRAALVTSLRCSGFITRSCSVEGREECCVTSQIQLPQCFKLNVSHPKTFAIKLSWDFSTNENGRNSVVYSCVAQRHCYWGQGALWILLADKCILLLGESPWTACRYLIHHLQGKCPRGRHGSPPGTAVHGQRSVTWAFPGNT